MSAVQLNGIHAGFLAADSGLDEIIPEVCDLTVTHSVHSGGAMIGQLDFGRCLHGPDDLFLFQTEKERGAFKNAVQDLRETVHDGNDHGQGVC